MKIKVYKDRYLISVDNVSASQYENLATTLEFEFPEFIEKKGIEIATKDLNKYIVFDIDSEENQDLIIDNKYSIPYEVTKQNEITFLVKMLEPADFEDMTDKLIWNSQKMTIKFNKAFEGNTNITSEKLDAFNTAVSALNQKTNEVDETIKTVETKVEDGELDGATFIPNVDNEGNISWSNNKGLVNPETVNIKGKQGVGIASVEQTVTSNNSGGVNVVEITLDNGEKSTIEIRNGKGGEGGGGGSSYDDTELRELIASNLKESIDYADNISEKKVDKAKGKSLISNSEITRLGTLKNYDDTELRDLINENLTEAKQYTDTEIANFDFIKIVDELPEVGLPNRVYFVPKQESETNNIFTEHAWINDKWEDFGTKIVDVDLTDVQADIEKLENEKADKIEIPDGILVDTIIAYDGEEIPEGYEEEEYSAGIETITNDKGKAVKFPDGTLINFIDKKVYDLAISAAYGSFYVSAPYLIDFPIPFSESKISAVCGALAWGSSASWGTIFSVGMNSCSVRGYDIMSRASGTETRVQVTAFGRWK